MHDLARPGCSRPEAGDPTASIIEARRAAAAAGLAWLFREPIKEHAPRAAGKLREWINAGLEKIRPGDSAGTETEETETAHETPQ